MDTEGINTTLVISSQQGGIHRRPQDEERPEPRRRQRISSSRSFVVVFEVEPTHEGRPEGVFAGRFHNEDTEV